MFTVNCPESLKYILYSDTYKDSYCLLCTNTVLLLTFIVKYNEAVLTLSVFSLAGRMSNQSEILQNVGENFHVLLLRRIRKLSEN